MPQLDLERYTRAIRSANFVRVSGVVTQVAGLLIEGRGPGISLGGLCAIHPRGGRPPIPAEVVGFRDSRILLMPLGSTQAIAPGSIITAEREVAGVGVGPELYGRVIGGLGEPLDGRGPLRVEREVPIYTEPLNPLLRRRISEPLSLGVRAIDGLLTCGKGQRLAILAGSGVGKSVLMGMIARFARADVNVVALVGERGREVRDFIERDLGEEGLERSVVVAATSDQPPLVRLRSAHVATAIAEYFRDEGKDVLLMMDSVTRFAMAQREVGLTVGEPPTTRGYTPSVFALLPRLLERAGLADGPGSITGIYTVLVEGDDINDPIGDGVRAIVDGHVTLSRRLAVQNHFPAIDVLNSTSRSMIDVVSEDHMYAAGELRSVLASYQEAEDLINIGAYAAGSNPDIDRAIRMIRGLRAFLRQRIEEASSYDDTIQQVKDMVKQGGAGEGA